MQVLVNGQAENFGDAKYQQAYAKDQCSADLTESPIHFHDNKDQFTHIHWDDMTGGMVLKYYGWNYIGGQDDVLGYRFDTSGLPRSVPIKGDLLPEVPNGSNFYVYTGDKDTYQERSFDDWKNKDLEQFFGKPSNVPEPGAVQTTWLEKLLFPNAAAHDGVDDGHPNEVSEEAKLKKINNLIGNVVPLENSTCTG